MRTSQILHTSNDVAARAKRPIPDTIDAAANHQTANDLWLISDRSSGGVANIAGYLRDMCAGLVASPGFADRAEFFQSFSDACVVCQHHVPSLVLIVSEAVTNAIKHSHPSGISGKIGVTCLHGSDGATVIEVTDDGVGLPEGFDSATDGGFGFQMMRGLSGQLGATLVFKSTCLGLCVRLRVPPNKIELGKAGATEETRGSAADAQTSPVAKHEIRHHGNDKETEGVLSGDGRFRELLEALPAAIYTTDPAGRITFYNEAAAALWGRRPELGKSAWCGSWRLYWPDGRPMQHDECPMAVALKERRTVRGLEAVAERPDGSRVPFIPFPTPLYDASGALVGAVNMLVDITERKRAEQDGQRLASIVESSDDAIVSKDLNGIIASWNRGAERLFGYAAEEVIGKSITILIPADRKNEEVEILGRIQRGERIDHYETVRVRKDGSLVPISLTVSPVTDVAGRIIGASKIARDITERNRAQEKQTLLVNEIKHRVKNTLATVQSIATQTLRGTPSQDLASFQARLHALARAHDLLTLKSWNGAPMHDVVARVLEPFQEKHRHRFVISGSCDVWLNANTSLLLTMALHELATNAAKYGALSNGSGQIRLAWELSDECQPPCVKLTWQERGGPTVAPPDQKGFGSRLIESICSGELGGARFEFHPQGVTCSLAMAL